MTKNQKYLWAGGLLLLTSGIVLAVQANDKAKKPKPDILKPDMDLTPYKEGGLNLIAEALKDNAFRDKVRTLQSKMNLYFSENPDKEFPYAPLSVDGLLGDQSLLGIIYIFGDKLLPIKDKAQIDYFNKNLK
jgi:hypothetical protein